MAEKFASAAGFRNILVHIYEEVYTNILRKLLTEDLKDFDTFAL
ncbi:MAG TPA: HepT-like ribonuclease domain-containing protein [Methanosarcina sp.]|nr:HepT-like ribonuclease domain-containing protein [Methanosarcina sp.]